MTEFAEAPPMYFKRLLPYCLLLISLLVSSCSLKIGEPEPARLQVTVNPVKGGCLKNAGLVFDRYFNGEISEGDLNDFWNCVHRSIVTFRNNSKGNEDGTWSADKLANFLSYYFLGKRAIPPTLVAEAMKLKAGILGGSTTSISKEDLKTTLEFVDVLQVETMRLRLYFPLSPQAIFMKSQTDAQFEETIVALTTATSNIGKALQGKIGVYSFQSLKNLLAELRAFLYGSAIRENDWMDQAVKTIEVAKSAKALLIGPPAEELHADDWGKLFQIVPRGYAVYLRANQYLKAPRDSLSGIGLRRFTNLIDEVFVITDHAIQNHAENKIRYADLEIFLDTLSADRQLPINKETMRSGFQLLFSKWFPTASTDGEVYFDHKSVDQIHNIILNWTEGSLAIEAAFKSLSGDGEWYSQSFSKDDLLALNPEILLAGTAKKNEISQQAIKDVQDTIRNLKTIMPPGQNIVVIPQGDPYEQFSGAYLIKAHLMRTATKFLMNIYGRTENGQAIGKSEFQLALNDVFPILTDLKLVTADTKKTLLSRFFEGNLFLYASDGSQMEVTDKDGNTTTEPSLDIHEALELEAILLSTVEKGSIIHEAVGRPCNTDRREELKPAKLPGDLAAQMDSYCTNQDDGNSDSEFSSAKIRAYCDQNYRDENGKLMIHPACFRARIAKHYLAIWDYIPVFQAFFGSSTTEKKVEFLRLLDGFTRGDRPNSWYTSGDTSAYILMPYYRNYLFPLRYQSFKCH